MRQLFGTNGIRGIIGDSMGPELALGIGSAFGTFVGRGKRIAVGRDPRHSGEMLSQAFSSGARAAGCDVVDLGFLPTPALQYYLKLRPTFGGGAIITASHNPPKFNGIKCVGREGLELSSEAEEEIERIYFSKKWHSAAWDACGSYATDEGAGAPYVDGVLSQVDAEAIVKAKLGVLLDCANGAACHTSPGAMRMLGCRLSTINGHPDGAFPGRMPEPTEENLKELVALCRRVRPDIAIAHDGDADRATFIDDRGRYVPGDESLAILAADTVSKARGGIVVAPVDTSLVVQEAVAAKGGKVDYTAIGSPIVTKRMRDLCAVFGGEGNGGAVFPKHQFCRDGLMSAAGMLDVVVRSGQRLSDIVDALPKFERRKLRIECPEKMKAGAMRAIEKRLGDAVTIKVDGLKIVDGEGWALIRTSGTEPIIRVVAESRSASSTEERVKSLRATVLEALGDAASGSAR
ncbi:MAG: phosphoglucosamine mutase [Euryarchaeota archaeon]|nr:phosphoglucosamine mutase [Euryarchaeota archaeon]